GFDDLDASKLIINPFVFSQIGVNPFKLAERTYPVDYGTTIEKTKVFQLEYPENYKLEYVPPAIGLSLPNKGGRYVYQLTPVNTNSVSFTESFQINKPVFYGNEYPHLKELYNKIIQTNKTEIILTKTN